MQHTGTEPITGTEDVLDSRDIDARIEQLLAIDEPSDEEQSEMSALVAFRDDMQGYVPDWSYGATLIRDDYMQAYAQETAEDCGMIPADAPWPVRCIDWDAATEQFKEDYTSATLMGAEYWGR